MAFYDNIYDEDENKVAPTVNPVDVMKSKLLGDILQGIPGVSGYPITQEAENMLLPQQQPVPLADLPPKAAPLPTKQPLVLPEMVIRAPQAPKDLGRIAKPEVLQPMTTPDLSEELIPEAPKAEQPIVEQPREDELDKALADRRNMMLLQAILKGSQQVGAGIAGVKPKEGYLSEYDKLIEEPVASVKEKRAAQKEKTAEERAGKEFEQNQKKMALTMDKLTMEMGDEKSRRDPNSTYSQGARAFQTQRLQTLSELSGGKIKFDPKVLEGMSAAQLEDSFGKASPENLASSLVQAQMRKDQLAESRMRFEETKAERQAQEKRRAEQFDQQQVERYTNTIQKSDSFKESERTINAVSRIKDLAKDAATRGGQSLAMLGPQVAKGIAGEVGVMTDKDVTRYVQNPSLAGGMVDTLNKVKAGKLSQVSYDNLMRLVEIMERKALASRELAYAKGATQLSRNSGLEYNKAYELLNPNAMPGEQAPTVESLSQKKETPKVDDEDKQAMEWAKKNPEDPRAKRILQLHGK